MLTIVYLFFMYFKSKVFVFYLLLYFLIFTLSIQKEWQIINILKTIFYTSFIALFYTLVQIASSVRLIPYINDFLQQGFRIGFHKGYLEFNLYMLPSFSIFIPFIFFSLTHNLYKMLKINRLILWFFLIFDIVVIMMSGRKGLILGTFLSIIIFSILALFMRQNKEIKIIFIITLTIFFVLFPFVILLPFDVNDFLKMMAKSFNFTTYQSNIIRATQFRFLLNAWKDKPLFGYGLGSYLKDYVRSNKLPFSYELSYIDLLFKTGLVGVSLYLGGIVWIFWKSIKIFKKDNKFLAIMFPVLSGTTALLIANTTNPYLQKFDYLNIIFLPLTIINVYKIKNKVNNGNNS